LCVVADKQKTPWPFGAGGDGEHARVLASSKEQAGVQDLDRHGPVIVQEEPDPSTPATTLRSVIRRTFRFGLRLGLLAGVAYAAMKLLQRRVEVARPVPGPSWPPVTPPTSRPAPQPDVRTPAPTPAAPPAPARPEPGAVPAPPPPTPAPPPQQAAPISPAPSAHAWVEPSSDGYCPQSHPIKAKLSSKIVHLPGMLAYDRTKPDRCYASESAAETDGFRKAKR
jgi:hypothetical protein